MEAPNLLIKTSKLCRLSYMTRRNTPQNDLANVSHRLVETAVEN